MSPVAPIDENMELLRSMADDRCPILGTRQPEARAAGWAWEEINRLRAAQNQTGRYSATLADLSMFADAACELDYLNGFIDPEAPEANQRITDLVNKLHDAIERIAGPDAGEIYATDDGSSNTESTPHAGKG